MSPPWNSRMPASRSPLLLRAAAPATRQTGPGSGRAAPVAPARSSPGPTASPAPSDPDPDPSAVPGDPSATGGPGGPGGPAGPEPSGPTPSDAAVGVVAPDGSGGTSTGVGAGAGDDAGGLEALAGALGTIAFGRPAIEPLGLALTLATTSTVVGATMAFSLFGKRRRDGEQPASDEVMARQAASGVAASAAALVSRPLAAAPVPPTPMDTEAAMPRWRRPSLLEARKADPIRDAVAVPRLTFDHGLVGPLDGRERRLIRYSVVRLLDTPDELRGAEIGFLDHGDEVQLLEKRGVYWLVLCPDGRQGWIHKMTLGDAVETPGAATAARATMPIDADTWTMGDDVDNDVLAAYLESRRRP